MTTPAASDTPGSAADLPSLLVPGAQFTLPELHAMKLDGVLAQMYGEAFRPVDVPETAGLRAAALAHHVPANLLRRAAVAQLSAAWVYGCAPPPRPIALLLPPGGKSAQLPLLSGCTLRQVLLPDSDVHVLSGLRLTVPLRTALDVARAAPEPLARTVLANMAGESGLGCGPDRVRTGLLAAVCVPGRRRGLELLEDMARML